MSNALSWAEWLAPLRDGKWRRFSDLWRRVQRDDLVKRSALGELLTRDHFRRMLSQHGAQRWTFADGHTKYRLFHRTRKEFEEAKPPKRAKPPTTKSYELAFSLPENGGCVFTSSTHHGETTVKLLCYGLPTKLKLEPMRQDGD